MSTVTPELIVGLRSLNHPYARQAANILDDLLSAQFVQADLAAAVTEATVKSDAVAAVPPSDLPPAVLELQHAVADVIKQFTALSGAK